MTGITLRLKPPGRRAALIVVTLLVVLAAFSLAAVLSGVLPVQGQEGSAPAQPTGLTVDAVSHDSVTLAWDDPSDSSITGYRVLRRSRDGDEYGDGQGAADFAAIEDDTGTAATSYTDSSVTPHTRYVYRVEAVNANGRSPRSGYVNVETPEAPAEPEEPEDSSTPAQPTGLTAGAVSHDSVTLAWDDPSDSSITGYRVLRRSRDGDEYGDGQGAADFAAIEDDTGTAATSYTDSSVTPPTRYVYRVEAVNANGRSPRSGDVNAETPQEPAPPAQPTGLVTAASESQVLLSWDDPSDSSITGYRVLRRSRDGDEYGDGQGAADFAAIEDDTGTAATSYTDSSVTPHTRYVYRVEAVNANGRSPRSGYVNVETPEAPAEPEEPEDSSTPAQPTGLTAGAVSHDSVTLAWDDPSDSSITGYRVLRRSRDGDEYGDGQGAADFAAIEDDTGTAATSYTDSSVTPPTRYVYRVEAVNANGRSPRSGDVNAETPQEPAPPAQPTGLVTAASESQVLLSWDDPSDSSITGYRVLRRSRDGDEYGDGQGAADFAAIEDDTGTAATSYTDSSVTPHTRYVYRVEAVNANGRSPRSGYVNVETPEAPAEPEEPEDSSTPTQPTGLTVGAVSHDSVTLAWDDPSDSSITGYRVLRRSRDGDEYGDGQGAADFAAIEDDTGTAATSYTDSSVTPHTRYVYRVEAVNANGRSPRSGDVNAETPQEPAPPAQPTGLVTAASESQVLLSWDDPGDDSITGYRVLRRSRDGDTYGDGQGPAGVTVIAEDTGSAAASYTDDTVAAGTRYAYRVQAINAQGPGPESPDAYAATPEHTPDPKKAQQTVRATVSICDRTDDVETTILATSAVTSTDCAAVDDAELAKITVLDLSSLSIPALASGDFAGLTGLTALYLHSNELSELPADVFDGLTSLTELKLSTNDLSALPKDVFDSLTSLTTLRLYSNSLTALREDEFDSLTSLTVLDLSSNQLTTLPENVFDNLAALTNLNLRNNASLTLPVAEDRVMLLLVSLTTYNNEDYAQPTRTDICSRTDDVETAILGQVPYTVPCGQVPEVSLAQIESLDLSTRGITGLQADDFAGLTGLETLDLRGNDPDWPLPMSGDPVLGPLLSLTTYNGEPYVRTVDICSRTQAVRDAILARGEVTAAGCAAVDIYELEHITNLNLRNRGITALRPGDLDGLRGLTFLFLERNSLTALPEDVFDDLAALTYLYLERNSLSGLPETVFDNLAALIYLDLRDNDPGWTLPESGDRILRHLASLTIYNGAWYTGFAYICQRTGQVRTAILAATPADDACYSALPAELAKITSLDLSGRNISFLRPDDFDGLTGLKTLDLRNNAPGWTPPKLGDRVLEPLVSLTTYNGAPFLQVISGQSLGVIDLGRRHSVSEQVAEDLTLHHAYGNSHPNGLWSDGSTLWVADGLSDWPRTIELVVVNSGDLRHYFIPFAPHILPAAFPPYLHSQGTLSSHDGISALYAYDLETGSRRPLSDILHGVERADVVGNEQEPRFTEEFSREGARLGPFGPTGVWSDGELLWLADESQVIKAYRLSSFRNRAEATGAAELAPGRAILLPPSHVARGLWSDRTTLWVVEGVSGELRAYNLADGRRMSQLDITGIEGDPWDIWSNGVTLWVSGWSDAGRPQVLAYYLAGGRRDPARDLPLLQVASDGLASLPAEVRGLWSDGERMWVSDGQSQVWVYCLNANASCHTEDGTLRRDRVLTRRVANLLTRDEGRDIVPASNIRTYTIWSDGETLWRMNNASTPPTFEAHSLSTGADIGRDVVLTSANAHPIGVWGNDSTIWVSDYQDDKLYAYDRTNGTSYDETRNIDLAGGNDNPRDIWGNDSTIWVADGRAKKLYAYHLAAGDDFGGRDESSEFDLAPGNDRPIGLWSDGNTIWVIDNTDDVAYAYALAGGARRPAKDLSLVVYLGDFGSPAFFDGPLGIWSDGTERFWVSYATNFATSIYAYLAHSDLFE